MNKTAFTLQFLFIALSAFSQTFEGNYFEGNDVLKFNNNRIYFDIEEMGSISNSVGEGTYEIVEDYLIVSAEEFSGEKTTMQALNASKKDTIVIKVTNHSNYPIQGVLVESQNAKGKTLMSGTTGNDGRILFLPGSKISKFSVFNMGSAGLTFDYKPGSDFIVKMAERVVVENKTAVFKIKEVDEETISVLLLSTDFNPGKDQLKALKKLDARAEKRNFLPKRLKKEYVPYMRSTN